MTAGQRGGRPRDPELTPKVLEAARQLLAEGGPRAFTSDNVAATARVGKASLYRRWSDLDQLLVDVVRSLCVPEVDHGDGPGTVREDLVRLLYAATTGVHAAAAGAVLSLLPYCVELQSAYDDGPQASLMLAIARLDARSAARGEPAWPTWAHEPIAAGVRVLQHEALTHGEQPNTFDVAAVVEQVVLPGLGYTPAVPA